MAYLTMVMCLVADDTYTEVATKVAGSCRGGLRERGLVGAECTGVTRDRQRLGSKVLSEMFEQLSRPVADTLTLRLPEMSYA